ncbi:MAG TPA: EF-hand domain-containing protein [Gemmataceae bacterium]|jgi:Ca2+-binding EF-hand superfamily protein
MRARFIAFLFIVVATGPAVAADKLTPVPGDAQDLVLFLDARPYLIRLHLQVNGRSFQASWEETIDRLFRYLDVDGDGALDRKEANLAPSNAQWVQLMRGTVVEPDAAPDFAAMKVTREAFRRYYRHAGAGALQVEWGWRPPAQDRLTDALFRQIDKDKDGSLSREELSAAQAALHQLDVDGDEMIRAFELDPAGVYPVFTFRSSTEQQQVPKNFPFAILQPDMPADTLTKEMLTRYDKNKDRKLSRTELPLEKAVFDRLDANDDGELDAAELAGWRKLPPELELIVPLERKSRKDVLVMTAVDGKPAALLPPSRDGALRIPVGEKQLELARNANGPTLRQNLLKQFDGMAGKNGVLNEKTIYQPPFTFVALLRLADRNGDNQLSHKELADFLELQEKFFFRSTYLTVMDRGPSLFEFLDADHDGRLGPRELRSAWKRLAPWDRDGSGRIARRQVPRQFQLVLSHGQPRANLAPARPGFGDMPLFRDRSRGPLWFRKMDRNSDGDVSPREFLGTAEQFRRLDADGDGLIDVAEAERADRELRKRP